jgi:Gpi18-like mannosyltransferase
MNMLATVSGIVKPAASQRGRMQKWLAGNFWPLFALVWLLGLMIRVPLLTLDTNITNDISVYRSWFILIRDQGLAHAYAGTGIDYPPLFLEWLSFSSALLAHLPAWLSENGAVIISIIKLPSLLADMLTAAVLAAAFSGQGRWPALAAAAAYLFNPAVWYVSAYWGQTDALYCLFLVLAIVALQRAAVVPAWVALALALGWKLQAGAVAPLLVVASLRLKGWRQLTVGLVAFALVSGLLWAPWLFSGLFEAVWNIRPPLNDLVISAYNLWYLVGGNDLVRLLAASSVPGLAFVYQLLARSAYWGAVAAITVVVWRARRMRLALSAALYCLAFFVLMVGVRERYLFPVQALLLLAQAEAGESETDRRNLWILYVVLSVTSLFNLVTVASFNHQWWINILAAQPETPFVRALRIIGLAAAAVNTIVTVWLFLWVARFRRRPEMAP